MHTAPTGTGRGQIVLVGAGAWKNQESSNVSCVDVRPDGLFGSRRLPPRCSIRR
ncbi:MAG: hypothetical protein ACLSVD_10075 [Eggerthellaceae bacterium]